MVAYVVTLTKIIPGEPSGQISDLLEDWGFNTLQDAEKRFRSVELNPVYIRKELWAKDTDTKVRKILMEEKYADSRQ